MDADAFSKLGSSSTTDLKHSMMIDKLPERSKDTAHPQVYTISHEKEWYDEMTAYKLTGSLPNDKMAEKKLKREVMWFCIF